MKKFKFSLETVLKWKRSQEEKALEVMGAAMKRRQEMFELLQASRRKLGALLQAIRQARQVTMDGWMQAAYAREVGRQEALCQHHQEMLQTAQSEEENARQAYLERRREAEALEKLKEKRTITYKQESARATEQELEEIMLSRLQKTEGSMLCSF